MGYQAFQVMKVEGWWLRAEGLLPHRLRTQGYGLMVSQPLAGVIEPQLAIVHHQIDGATTGIADVTAVAVAGGREG